MNTAGKVCKKSAFPTSFDLSTVFKGFCEYEQIYIYIYIYIYLYIYIYIMYIYIERD